MGFFAETPGRSVWLLGIVLVALTVAIAFAAMHRCGGTHRHRRAQPASFEKFDHYKPVKRCVDGRWVIAHERSR